MRAAQRYENVVITGLAHLDGPHVVTSTELEDRLAGTLARLKITPGLLERLSGIAERRVWDEGTRPSAVATQVGEEALARSGVRREDIGAVINTSVTRDHLEPRTRTTNGAERALTTLSFAASTVVERKTDQRH